MKKHKLSPSHAFKSLRESPRFSKPKVLVVIIAFAIIGSIFLFLSHAATPTANIQPETGTVASPAITGSDTNASGGSYVQFKAAGTGGNSGASCTDPLNAGPSNASILTASAPITVTQANAVIQNVNVNGGITVNAANVTIKNFRAGFIDNSHGTGTIVQDGELTGAGSGEGAVVYSNYTLKCVNVHNSFDGLKVFGNVNISYSYIHDMNAIVCPDKSCGNTGYTHNDGIQMGGGSNVSITNSRFERTGINSGIFIDPDQGTIDNVTIDHNYFDGDNVANTNPLATIYLIFVVSSGSAPQFGLPTNVRITNNTFGSHYKYPEPDSLCGDIVLSNNTFAANGAPIPLHRFACNAPYTSHI
jgi:hypothetical protein